MSSLSSSYSLSGPLSSRSLGTRSGDLRRLARQARHDGVNPRELYLAASEAKLGQPRIGNADDDIRSQPLEQQIQGGLLESRRRSLLQQGGGSGGMQQIPPAPYSPPARTPQATNAVSPSPQIKTPQTSNVVTPATPPKTPQSTGANITPVAPTGFLGGVASAAISGAKQTLQDNADSGTIDGKPADLVNRDLRRGTEAPFVQGPPVSGSNILSTAMNEALGRRAARAQADFAVPPADDYQPLSDSAASDTAQDLSSAPAPTSAFAGLTRGTDSVLADAKRNAARSITLAPLPRNTPRLTTGGVPEQSLDDQFADTDRLKKAADDASDHAALPDWVEPDSLASKTANFLSGGYLRNRRDMLPRR